MSPPAYPSLTENKFLSINHLYASSPGVLMMGKPKRKAVDACPTKEAGMQAMDPGSLDLRPRLQRPILDNRFYYLHLKDSADHSYLSQNNQNNA